MLLSEQPTYAYGCFGSGSSQPAQVSQLTLVFEKWFKTNIQRKAAKRQKDRAPLSQSVVRQRRPFYPYNPYSHQPLLYDSIVEGSGHPTGFEPQLLSH